MISTGILILLTYIHQFMNELFISHVYALHTDFLLQVGPETSLSTSNLSERNERSMASSVKSNSSRKAEKKSEKLPTAAPSMKPAVRPQGKDHPVWK